ncbi:hypothetical protein SALBM135S_03859 [Streptomyces alboniger]
MQRMTTRGVEWLSAAADDPAECRATWAGDPRAPYAMAAGRYFDVVSVEQRLGMETFDQLLRRGMPFGPVVLDRKAWRVGFFLGSQNAEAFTHCLAQEEGSPPAYRYLGHGSVVVVPGPMPMSDDRYQWLRAPPRRPTANPLRPMALATMLVASAELLARVDRYGQRATRPRSSSPSAFSRRPRQMRDDATHQHDAATWSPLNSDDWYAARNATTALRDALLHAGPEKDFPYLRADLNAFGHGLVELGRVSPATAERLAELLRQLEETSGEAATDDAGKGLAP